MRFLIKITISSWRKTASKPFQQRSLVRISNTLDKDLQHFRLYGLIRQLEFLSDHMRIVDIFIETKAIIVYRLLHYSLRLNMITDCGAALLAKSVKYTHPYHQILRSLNLNCNLIDDDGACALAGVSCYRCSSS